MFMNELRQGKFDYKRWVVIAPKRAKRPHKSLKAKICFFCPGNEKLTPPEIFRVSENGNWIVRVFPNKYPAFSIKYPKAYGVHWVIVDTPNHIQRFSNLSKEHMHLLVHAYIKAIKMASAVKGIRNVLLFKNEGKEAGMSSDHMHSQLIGTKQMFPKLEEELNTCKHYLEKHGTCIFCDLIKDERNGKRFVYENEDFIAFCPYASVFPYNVMIFPARHKPDFTKMSDKEVDSFTDILKKIIVAISTLGYGYNFYIHTSNKPYHHFHLEIRPRPNIHAGFELGSGMIINTMPPEEAAKYLRKKIKKR
jgi:UDPglucose--hexose-1-phosphate uridylyltransferase